jgi:hypothetical protein
MTCIAWNLAADPFMFATGSHDGTVKIWTTPETSPPNNTHLALPEPRVDVSAPKPTAPSPVHFIVPLLREPSHRYIPRLKRDSADTTEKPVSQHEMLAVSSEYLSTVASRRHSWV